MTESGMGRARNDEVWDGMGWDGSLYGPLGSTIFPLLLKMSP